MALDITQYRAPTNLLENHIILVTGAGDGIGKSAAIHYAQAGATVILSGRTLNKLEAVYDEIEAHGLAQPAIFPINFESATEQDYKALRDAIENEFGHLDGILHNAAELGPRKMLTQYAANDWQKILSTNLSAPFLLTKHLLPLFSPKKGGSILFTSSSVGRKGRAFWGAYAVSKAGIENLVQILAEELEGTSKVRVNSINPGATRTRMRAAAYPAESPNTIKSTDDIMNAYLYLMGRDSQDLSGLQFDAQ